MADNNDLVPGYVLGQMVEALAQHRDKLIVDAVFACDPASQLDPGGGSMCASGIDPYLVQFNLSGPHVVTSTGVPMGGISVGFGPNGPPEVAAVANPTDPNAHFFRGPRRHILPSTEETQTVEAEEDE